MKRKMKNKVEHNLEILCWVGEEQNAIATDESHKV